MRKTIYTIIVFVMIIPFIVSCSSKTENSIPVNAAAKTADEGEKIFIESPMTLSNSICTFNGKPAYLRLKMVKGKYYEDWNPGPVMGTLWEGYYTIELADESGNTIMQSDFSKLYNAGREPLTFRSSFDMEFEDYNGDGDMDFTVGQYASSNGREYKLFTIRGDGKVEELPVKDYPTLFISGTTGYYSTRLTKIDNVTFKKEYYDNSVGRNVEDTFRWNGNAFIHISSQERKDLTVEDMKIGDIQIGSSIEIVQRLYGDPSEKTTVHGIGDPLWYYKNQGLEVSFGGPIWRVRVTEESVGSTPRGIHVKSTKKDVISAYPNVKEIKDQDRTSLLLISSDRKYSIYFGLENDIVTSILLDKDLVIGTEHDKDTWK